MTNKRQPCCAERRTQASTELAYRLGQPALPVWRASVRMALVCAAGMVAAGLIATGVTGCADMSGIAPQASLRDAASLGLDTANVAQAPLAERKR